MVFTRWNKFRSVTEKKKQIFCLFHGFNPFLEKLYQNPVQFFSVIPHGVPLLHSNALQYYIKRKKCKVNDVIFPSGCEAHAINLGIKNMKICIFTGHSSVRLKNIFTDISWYPTRKHERKFWLCFPAVLYSCSNLQFLFCLHFLGSVYHFSDSAKFDLSSVNALDLVKSTFYLFPESKFLACFLETLIWEYTDKPL